MLPVSFKTRWPKIWGWVAGIAGGMATIITIWIGAPDVIHQISNYFSSLWESSPVISHSAPTSEDVRPHLTKSRENKVLQTGEFTPYSSDSNHATVLDGSLFVGYSPSKSTLRFGGANFNLLNMGLRTARGEAISRTIIDSPKHGLMIVMDPHWEPYIEFQYRENFYALEFKRKQGFLRATYKLIALTTPTLQLIPVRESGPNNIIH